MKLYKYLAVRDKNSSYIESIILNEKPSLRATNAFGFADRLEGLVNCADAYLNSSRKMNCTECKLQKGGTCTRKHLCQLCSYYYSCKEVGTPICSRGYKNKYIHEDCIDNISDYELFHRYIFCLSIVGDSNALIEKFCGRLGFVLEYDVIDASRIVNVTYDNRPIATPADKIELSKLISQHGYGCNNISVVKHINRLLGYKQKEFEYEQECRIITSDISNNEYYKYFKEEELGIKLSKVTFVYDAYMQNLNHEVFDVLDSIGKAVVKRNATFELNSSTDFVNGNNINCEHANANLRNNITYRKKFLSELGASIKNGD